MRRRTTSDLKPLAGLKVIAMSKSAITLSSRHGLMELSVLAPNIFRIRATSAKKLSQNPSWAVCKTDWPPLSARIRASRNQAWIETSFGRLSFHLHDGAWHLLDKKGRVIFESVPTETGFGGASSYLCLALADDEAIFGLGETTGTFNKRGLIREFWNTDALCHAPAIHHGMRSLYVSIPFAISIRDGRAAGLFWDNPARQTWDLGQTQLNRWQMKAAAGEMDLYLFTGPKVSDVVARFTQLTGQTPLPPRWALGYHQSRYSYETRDCVEEIAKNFRDRKIPCDAIYLDIHHMDDYRVFTFGKRFPKPAKMISKLARQGFKLVAIVDPGVKDDSQFSVFKRGRAADAFVKAPGGKKDFVAKVWPGASRFPDFLNARVRRWWADEQGRFHKFGLTGFWNDMNEPSTFDVASKTMPDDCVHQTEYGAMNHSAVHNLYGMQMARASREGALKHRPDRRPFVITRAGYAGVQRYALVWTGDNSSSWEHLADSVQMLLNLGLSGVAFCGADVGGFFDNTTPELLVRWTQLAAFTPFFRNHSHIGTVDQEPWAFSRSDKSGKQTL